MQTQSLSQENPLEKEMAIHSAILAWEKTHGQRSLVDHSPRGHKESDMTKHTHTHTHTHTRVNMYKERGKIIAPGPRNQNNDGAIDKK